MGFLVRFFPFQVIITVESTLDKGKIDSLAAVITAFCGPQVHKFVYAISVKRKPLVSLVNW